LLACDGWPPDPFCPGPFFDQGSFFTSVAQVAAPRKFRGGGWVATEFLPSLSPYLLVVLPPAAFFLTVWLKWALFQAALPHTLFAFFMVLGAILFPGGCFFLPRRFFAVCGLRLCSHVKHGPIGGRVTFLVPPLRVFGGTRPVRLFGPIFPRPFSCIRPGESPSRDLLFCGLKVGLRETFPPPLLIR